MEEETSKLLSLEPWGLTEWSGMMTGKMLSDLTISRESMTTREPWSQVFWKESR